MVQKRISLMGRKSVKSLKNSDASDPPAGKTVAPAEGPGGDSRLISEDYDQSVLNNRNK